MYARCISGSACSTLNPRTPRTSKGVVKIVDISLGISFRPPASSADRRSNGSLSSIIIVGFYGGFRHEAEIREGLFRRFFPTFRPFSSISFLFNWRERGIVDSSKWTIVKNIYKSEKWINFGKFTKCYISSCISTNIIGQLMRNITNDSRICLQWIERSCCYNRHDGVEFKFCKLVIGQIFTRNWIWQTIIPKAKSSKNIYRRILQNWPLITLHYDQLQSTKIFNRFKIRKIYLWKEERKSINAKNGSSKDETIDRFFFP